MSHPTAPSVIVFDLGKVLVDFDFSIASRRVAARSRLAVHETALFTEQADLLFRYEIGRIDTRVFIDEMRRVTGFEGTAAEFGDLADIFTPIQPMIDLHAAVRRKGFPTYIFSNTNELAIQHIRKHYPFFAQFDRYILSYEHGAMKPETRLYEVVERETKRRGGEIFYLDDRPENIATGAARGWQAVLHESPEKTKAALESLGL